MKLFSLYFGVVAVVVGCGGDVEQTGSLATGLPAKSDGNSAAPATEPVVISSRSMRDPALFLGPGNDAPVVGYIGNDATVVVNGPPQQGRVPVEVRGGLKFEGWLDARALEGVVQRRGKVKGAPIYLAPGDRVTVLKMRADGLSEIEVTPRSEVLARSGIVLGPYRGLFPTVGLGSSAPSDAEAPREGSWQQVNAGTQVQVYDAPNGKVIAVLSQLREPLSFAVLRNGDWKGVRIGQGPFLVGFINVETQPAAAPSQAPRPEGVPGGVPQRLNVDRERPLWRIKQGTAIAHGQNRFATLTQDGYAREMGRFDDGMVDVFVAVDHTLAVRGLAPASSLEQTGGAPSPQKEPTSQPGEQPEDDKPKVSPVLPPPTSPELSPTGGVPSPPQ